jgi:ferritin
MLSKPVLDLMNEQIAHEFYSAFLYLSMAAYFESENLPGCAGWMRVQFKEEQEHAMKFYDYILDRGGKVSLKALPQPDVAFTSPLDVFKKSYEHEQKVTALINNIYAAATDAKDTATQVFLHWFINEQVEEEKNVSSITEILTKIGSSVGGLYQIDHQLGKRGGED